MTANPTEAFNLGLAVDRLLSWREVKTLAGISRTTAWRLQKAGEFPRPVMISPGRVGWRESDVTAWRAALIPRGPAQPAPRTLFEPPPIRAVPPTPPAPAAIATPASNPHPTAPMPRAPRRRASAPPGQLSFDF